MSERPTIATIQHVLAEAANASDYIDAQHTRIQRLSGHIESQHAELVATRPLVEAVRGNTENRATLLRWWIRDLTERQAAHPESALVMWLGGVADAIEAYDAAVKGGAA
jgi:hypothetical protein